jgi:hypothetical protein
LPPGGAHKSWGSYEVRGSATAASSGLKGPLVLFQGTAADYASRVVPTPPTPIRTPNIHPAGLNVPRMNDGGFEELCHLVTDEDPDTALCGKDVTGYPWNPPWPWCEACLAVSRGEMN